MLAETKARKRKKKLEANKDFDFRKNVYSQGDTKQRHKVLMRVARGLHITFRGFEKLPIKTNCVLSANIKFFAKKKLESTTTSAIS